MYFVLGFDEFRKNLGPCTWQIAYEEASLDFPKLLL